MKKTIAQVLAILAVLLLAIFVWPTRYRYDHVKMDSVTFPVRIDRFTGKAEVLYPNGGWASTDFVVPSRDSTPKSLTPFDSSEFEVAPNGKVESKQLPRPPAGYKSESSDNAKTAPENSKDFARDFEEWRQKNRKASAK